MLFKIKVFLLFVLVNSTYISFANDTIRLLFAGDIMQHKPQITSAYENGTYNYEPCFRYVKDEISSADVAFANLEVPLAGKPYTGYPQFSAPDEIASALKDAGFDILVTANNHSCDKGAKGIQKTIETLDSFKILHTGIFKDNDERNQRYPLFFVSKGLKFALLNYTYGTNGIPNPKPFIVNLIDTAQISKDIAKAKQENPHIIIAFMHWGVEYAQKPNNEQKQLADFLIRKGVNLVIGAHPHVIQPMEKRYRADGKSHAVIAYSLGNYISNQSTVNSDGGAMVRIDIIKNNYEPRIGDAQYSLVWIYKPKINNKQTYYILPAARYKNGHEDIAPEYQKKIDLFLKNSYKLLESENVGFREYKF